MSLLAVDIGNTTISLGLVQDQRVLKSWRIESSLQPSDLQRRLKSAVQALGKSPYPPGAVVICSVVPHLTGRLRSVLSAALKVKALTIGRDIKVPIINRYRNPGQVGQDRLVCSFAAELYGTPLIVIDFGTAITFDVVSAKREYLGGIIVPGIRLSAEALWKKTALLPKVRIKAPRELIGRDTKGSILSGIFYGYGALCDGLIERIAEALDSKPHIILTGGYSRLMSKFISQKINVVDEDLIFKGMGLLFRAMT